jgi:ABC-type polysaccharide/polyol phosphate export permease
MGLTGLLVGWRVRTSLLEGLAGFLLLLAFAYAISWVMATVGLSVSSVEVVNNASFLVIFPLTFIANTFVGIDGLPGPVKTFAEWNPVSAVTQAVRQLFGNLPSEAIASDAWPLQNPLLASIIYIALILVIFIPLAVNQYKKAASR